MGREATTTGRLTPLADLSSMKARALTSIVTRQTSLRP
jgi:hypothetical protein